MGQRHVELCKRADILKTSRATARPYFSSRHCPTGSVYTITKWTGDLWIEKSKMYRFSCLKKCVLGCLILLSAVITVTFWQLGVFTPKVAPPCLLVYNDYAALHVVYRGTKVELPFYRRSRRLYTGVSTCLTLSGLIFYFCEDTKIGLLPLWYIFDWKPLSERRREPLASAIQWIPVPEKLQHELLQLHASSQLLFITHVSSAENDGRKSTVFYCTLSSLGSWRTMGTNILSVRAHPHEGRYAILDRRGFVAICSPSGQEEVRIKADDVIYNLIDWDVDFLRKEVFFLIRKPSATIIRRGTGFETTIRLSKLITPLYINVCPAQKQILTTSYITGPIVVINAHEYNGRWRGEVKGVRGTSIVFKPYVSAGG